MTRWILLILCVLASACQSAPPLPAELVVLNGKIWTGASQPEWVEALAVREGRIVAVGSQRSLRPLLGAETEVLDLQGGFAMPGFIDNHVHLMEGGFQLLGVSLREARDEEDLARRLGEYARTLPDGSWILGGNWDHESWPSQSLPHRSQVDPFTPRHPVFVTRLDGHMGLANTLALERAGINARTPDPPGGQIVRDGDGSPTGILKDAAMDLVYAVIPPPTRERLLEAARAALQEARRLGVTTLNVMAAHSELPVLQELHRAGELTARLYLITPLPEWSKWKQAGVERGLGDDFLRVGAVKGYVDGSLGSTTAWFFDPYNDAPQTSGLPNAMWFPEGNLKRLVWEADRANLHLAIHAIGDRANHELLNIYQELLESAPPKERRLRIEHAQHLRPDTINRFAALGVIPSMQPYHAIDDGRWAEKRIGPERIRGTYAFRSLLDSGAFLTFGSDWPVAPLNPLLGVYAAVTRRTLDGAHPEGWVPEQKITLQEALVCYTRHNAYAMFAEEKLGTLEVGKLADLVVLSGDPFQVPPEELGELRVVRTILHGRTVYRP